MLAFDALAKFRDYLYKNKLKYTPEREMIFTEIFRRKGHFEADELARELEDKGLRVSRATVYRTLDILHELNFVSCSTFGHRHQHYECILGRNHHDHLICLVCDKVIEFYDEKLERRQDVVCEEHNFEIKRHNLQIFGYCSDECKKKDNK